MKKSLITMLVALVLVAAVGVGATLAYLTDSTEEKINTFTVGDVDIDLTEEADAARTDALVEETEDGYSFTNLQPGDVVNKKPVVTVAEGSNKCYVYVKVSEVDYLTADIDEEDWEALGNGIYRFVGNDNDGICEAGDAITVFETVTVDADDVDEDTTFGNIVVQAAAVQAANISVETADSEALDLF